MPVSMSRFILTFFLCFFCAPAMAAQINDFGASVPGLSGKTWLDLVKKIVPDAKPAEAPLYGLIGHEGIALRFIEDGQLGEDWAETINVIGLDGEVFEVGGRKRIIVALNLQDADVSPLALFEGEGEGKLLDAIDVRTDMHTSYNETMTRPLGRNGALVTSKGWHSNSSQSYRINSLVMIGPEKFSLIGQVFVYGDNDCRSQIMEKESIVLVPAEPFAEIRVSIAHSFAKLRKDCSTIVGKPDVKIAHGSFTWDAAKNAYVGKTEQLDKLAKENEKRF